MNYYLIELANSLSDESLVIKNDKEEPHIKIEVELSKKIANKLREIAAEPEWIPINKKHPGSGLVFVLPKNTFLSPTVAFWECGRGFYTLETRRSIEVAYWMPIPPPPREAGESK